MSFKVYLKDHKKDQLIEVPSPNEAGKEHFYSVSIKEDWKDRWVAYKNKLLGTGNTSAAFLKEVTLLGEETIFVETINFRLALQTAIKYFSKNLKHFKTNQLGWTRIAHYTPEPIKDNTDSSTDQTSTVKSYFNKNNTANSNIQGFKFYLNPRKDPVSENFQLTDTRYINLNHYVLRKTDSTGDYIKLISLVNNDLQLTYEVLYNFCEELNIPVNKKVIQKVIDSQNNWVHVGKDIKRTVANPKYKIFTNEDKSKLYFKLDVARGRRVGLTLQTLKQILIERDLDVNIITSTAETYLNGVDFTKPIVLAEGVSPVHGKDAYIEEVAKNKHAAEHKKNIETKSPSQKIYQELPHFIAVAKNEVIARKHPMEQGKDGLSIYNQVIPANEAKDIEFKGGKNTELSPDGLTLTATQNGNLHRDSNKFWTVEEVLRIKNVDAKSGNITHLGTVIIEDSISDGYSVVTSGNLYVQGSVGVATIEAGGDIVLAKGVNGKNKATLTSHFGNVRAKYLQDVTVTTEGNVVVEELISDCIINAGDKIEVLKSRGIIWGGTISATKAIITSNVGSVSGRKTVLEVGVPFPIRIRLNDCYQEISHVKSQILTLQDNLHKAMNQGQDQEASNIRAKLKNHNTILKKTDAEISRLLESREENYVPCFISVKHHIYANATIKCQAATLHNKRYRTSLVFSSDTNDAEKFNIEPYIFKESEKQFRI
ncbi:hypothetical protein COTS27_00783 [Spirochaetota bacterium]|nr:hypothetical protein COTS27_00783 [Spirochaetota bacterium]